MIKTKIHPVSTHLPLVTQPTEVKETCSMLRQAQYCHHVGQCVLIHRAPLMALNLHNDASCKNIERDYNISPYSFFVETVVKSAAASCGSQGSGTVTNTGRGTNRMEPQHMQFEDNTQMRSLFLVTLNTRPWGISIWLMSVKRLCICRLNPQDGNAHHVLVYVFKGLHRDHSNRAFIFSDILHGEISQAVSWNEKEQSHSC